MHMTYVIHNNIGNDEYSERRTRVTLPRSCTQTLEMGVVKGTRHHHLKDKGLTGYLSTTPLSKLG